jgi:protein TonB
MAYADQRMSAGRVWAIVIVALLHALIGYAFVSGLAYSVIKQMKEDLKTFDVEEPPPPEEEPPPLTTPPPLNRLQQQNPLQSPPPPPTPSQFDNRPPTPTPAPAGPPPQPPPQPTPPQPPRVAARRAELRSGSISNDDYPASALRAEAQGTTVARYTIGPDGRVTACSVAASSGNGALDATTCQLIQRRFRFRPAIGSDGNPTSETKTQRVVWRLPSD